jgi:hypothetical protein
MGLSLCKADQAQHLQQAYQAFLESKCDPEVGRDLAQALQQVGLSNDGHALAAYCDCGSHSVAELEWGTFKKRRCFIGTNLPLDAHSGDLWFDIVELAPMILVPAQDKVLPDMREWVSIRPVFTWQFQTFLKLTNWHLLKKDFVNVTDLMDTNRSIYTNEMEYITDVYHEEAVAYAHWFGKQLVGQITLEKTKEFVTLEQFIEVLPDNFCLWDGSEYACSEFVRIAVGHNTLDKDPDDEFELRQTGENTSLANRNVI